MKKKNRIKTFENMYKSLTDPEEVEKAKRRALLQKMKEDKIKDVGL